MKSKRVLAAFIAAVMTLLNVLAAVPALARSRTTVRYATPAGYDDHDYQAVVAFLETVSPDGVKNGDTLGWLCGFDYDPADPGSWGLIVYEDPDMGYIMGRGFIWNNDSVRKLRAVQIEVEGDFDSSLISFYGTLDLSGCTALETILISEFDHLEGLAVANCPVLYSVWCGRCGIPELDCSGCPEMMYITCSYEQLIRIDVSDCSKLEQLQLPSNRLTSIDLSHCPKLNWLSLIDNQLTSLDVSHCPELELLWCEENDLTSLSVDGLTKLYNLHCNDNRIASLNINGCTEITDLYCQNNRLTELDFTGIPYPYFKTVHTEGSGFVGYKCGMYVGLDRASAEPKPGAEFLGWYAEDGSLISTETELLKDATDKTAVTARFTVVAALPGDVNGDGFVNANDALLVLRSALGLAPALGSEADVTGDGFVNANDALLILRVALGLAEL